MRRFRKRLILAAVLATTMAMVGAGPASADQTCGPNVVTTLCFPV